MKAHSLVIGALICAACSWGARGGTTSPGVVVKAHGDGSDDPRRRPRRIAVGSGFACAVTHEQRVRCWGSNSSGQLGYGLKGENPAPVTVEDLAGVVEVGAGTSHACARTSEGAVYCWGSNRYGQLGTGDRGEQALSPQRVPEIHDAARLAVGERYACSLSSGGELLCWGSNLHGQLGDGTTESPRAPASPIGIEDVVDVSAGGFACALLSSGGAECWGINHGESPAPIGLDRVRLIVPGGTTGCAIVEDAGRVACWGSNRSGELAMDVQTERKTEPVPIEGAANAVDIAVGRDHVCLLDREGKVRCWGAERANPRGFKEAGCLRQTDNSSGGGAAMQWQYCAEPTRVPGVSGVHQIAAGGRQTCALFRARARCWGGEEPRDVSLAE